MAPGAPSTRSETSRSGDGRFGNADRVDEPPGVITRFRRGVIAGLSIPLLGLIILAVPVMLAWIVPGSDSVSAKSALRAAALALLSGLHGGVVLSAQLSTLPPLAVTALLGWLVCGPARRLDSTSGFVGLVGGFTLSCLALARWSSLGQTYAPIGRSGVAGAIFMIVVGGVARWSPQLWARIGPRWRRVAAAAGAVLVVYVAAGALTVAGQIVVHHSAVGAIEAKVAPGAGGLAILLLGVGAAPNAVVAAVGYLTGFGFDVGANTSVSARSVSRGPLPDFPMLAALPHAAGLSAPGVILVCLSAVLAGAAVVKMVKPTGRRWQGLADITSVALLAGAGLGVLGTYARGGVGAGALRGIGVLGWQICAGTIVCVFAGSITAAAGAWTRQALRRPGVTPSLTLVSSVEAESAGEEVPAAVDTDAEITASSSEPDDPKPAAPVSDIRPTG